MYIYIIIRYIFINILSPACFTPFHCQPSPSHIREEMAPRGHNFGRPRGSSHERLLENPPKNLYAFSHRPWQWGWKISTSKC